MSVRRLITDADVLAGRVSSPIVLDAGTLLTPAARDRAVAKGMAIVERDAATSAASSAPGSAPTANRGHGIASPAASAPGPAHGVSPAGPPTGTTPACSRCGGRLTEAPCTTCGGAPCRCATVAPAPAPACSCAGGCGGDCASCSQAASCEHATAPGAAAAPAAAGHVCAEPGTLGDGLWLVRVENGVAVSVLPAAGAGQLTPARRD